MNWTETAIGITVALLAVYYWSTSTFDFWNSRGVTGPRPRPYFGNALDLIVEKISIGEYLRRVYDKYRDSRIIGIYARREPCLIIRDLDLIKDVIISDFPYFTDRGFKTFDKVEPLTQHLINLEPARWHPLRKKLSPVFTSGKLRKMFYLLVDCGHQLENYLNKITNDEKTIEVRELTARYTTDVIGTCAFGLRMNALTDENSKFRKIGRDIFLPSWKNTWKFRIRDWAPSLYPFVGRFFVDWKVTNFFLNIMRQTVEHRTINNIVKHDFIDLIRELRENPDKVGDIELTDMVLTAQLYVFFLAGFETSSTNMSHTLYELAQNQSIQDRLRDEIIHNLSINNGELTYDSIKAMKYLDMVNRETLRKYPPATLLIRRSTKPYTFAGTKVSIPIGTKIFVPVFGIHRDSEIYPEPEVFDPERFTEEAIGSRHPMSWLPFGNGPRNCIGARFANYQSKVGLIKILQNYRVEVGEKTQIPYITNPNGFLLSPTHGIHLDFIKIN